MGKSVAFVLLSSSLMLFGQSETPREYTLPEFKNKPYVKAKLKPARSSSDPIRRLPISNDYVRMALADLLTIAAYNRVFTRYIKLPPKAITSLKTTSLALNYGSRN